MDIFLQKRYKREREGLRVTMFAMILFVRQIYCKSSSIGYIIMPGWVSYLMDTAKLLSRTKAEGIYGEMFSESQYNINNN